MLESSSAPDHDSPDRSQAAEDHHREDEDREAELELAGVDQRRVCAEERARDAAERRAQRVGVELRADQRDAHRDGGDLVLAQRDPGSPQPRVAHPQVHEQRDQDEHEDRVVPGSDVQLAERADPREVRRVGPADPELATGQRHPEDLQRRSLEREHPDDLPERERHDRDVVAAQPQRRHADDGAGECGQQPRADQDQHEAQVDSRQRGLWAVGEDVHVGLEEPAGAEPAERV